LHKKISGQFSFLLLPGQKKAPALTSSRVIFLTTHLTAVIILTCYSAYLVSSITTKVYELPFNSFEEFLKAGTHHLVVEPHSSQITYFKVQFESLLFLVSIVTTITTATTNIIIIIIIIIITINKC